MNNFFIVVALALMLYSCGKNKEQILTVEAKKVLINSAEVHGRLIQKDASTVTRIGFCWSANQNPSVRDSIYLLPYTTADFHYTIRNLSNSSLYYFRAIGITDGDTSYGEEMSFTTWDGKLTDVDGNTYQAVQMKDMVWMAENLRTTHYSDGTPVMTSCKDNRYLWYGEGHSIMPNKEADMDNDNDIDATDSILYVTTHGLLYNWSAANNVYGPGCIGLNGQKVAAMSNDICPTGWHVPTSDEWQELRNFVAVSNGYNYSYDSIAYSLRSKHGWDNVNNGDDRYGFNALPSGDWQDPIEDSYTKSLGTKAYFWSSTAANSVNAGFTVIANQYYDGSIAGKQYGFSIRCKKDD